MGKTAKTLHLLIASYLEPEYVERIQQTDPRINVIYEPELIAPQRFPADHIGGPFKRSEEQEKKWRSLLEKTDILFDFDRTNYKELPELAPNLKWIQTTSSGIGQTIKKWNYHRRMPNTIFTSSRGVHAQPLAEFCLLAMLTFNKKLFQTLQQQKEKKWARLSGTDLRQKTIGIIGMGKVGQEVARIAQCFGMTVLGMKRNIDGIPPASIHADELFRPDELPNLLQRSEYLVLIAPHTPETEKMIGEKELALLPKGAVLINIARGALVDEAALVKALQTGHLRGAGLDVFEVEPLPPSNPLWTMENVIVSPHSGSTSDGENELITDIFCENIANFLEGKPMRNLFDTREIL